MPETRGREKFADGELCYVHRCEYQGEPWATNSKYCPDGAGYFWERGMIFAKRAMTGPLRWRATD